MPNGGKMEKLLGELINRVDLLIKLQVLVGFERRSQKEKVIALYGVGVPQKDIARILGVKGNIVSAVISQQRGRKARQRLRTNKASSGE
jgi:hypothetical protein